MSKAWKITVSIISGILGAILIFLAVYYLWPWNKKFFDNASKEFAIPGLDTDFAPQGFDNIDGSDRFVIGGYMNDGSPSRFYVINDGNIEKYFTLRVSDSDYTGHAGGIVSVGGTFWVVGDKRAYRFHLSQVDSCENGGSVDVLDSFATNNGADFVFENNGYLWIGEFYRDKNYETDKSHWLQTRSGETNQALAFGYKIDESKSFGLVSNSPTPDKALSIRGLAQGIAVTSDGRLVVSCSYGLKDSNLYVYKPVLNEEKHGTYILGKHTIDLWYLDNDALINTINAPAMSEEICIKDSRLYILFESSAKKYRLFNRKALKNVYSLSVGML